MAKWKTNLMLLTTAAIWGMAFVAQKVGMDYVGPLAFNALRFFIGGTVLLPVIAIMDRHKVAGGEKKTSWSDRTLLAGGACCGAVLCGASILQQYAVIECSVGKVGFITSMYMVLVPIFAIFLKKRTDINTWLAVAVAAVGMYFLCVNGRFSLERGDTLAFLCAVGFAWQILVVDHFSPKTDAVKLSCLQFFSAGIIAGIAALIFEDTSISGIMSGWMPILYAGAMSCAVAYTLQVVAQKYAQPASATLIMSLESVFSLLGGWLLLHQILSGREIFGCVLVFAGVLLSQFPAGTLKKQ